jgi:hypothetical protein
VAVSDLTETEPFRIFMFLLYARDISTFESEIQVSY